MDTRIIFSDDSTLEDITINANDYHSGSDDIAFVAADDKLFIGSYLPFNHLYIKMGSNVNANASVMTIKYWDGSNFREVAELIDETKSSGATLAQSGFITFIPHKKYDWREEDTVDVEDNEEVTDLGSVKIYERYWIQITVSADLTASTDLAWVGNLFNKNDNDIEGRYPELANSTTKTNFESGKTDWEEQRVEAAKEIIQELKRRNIIKGSGQILERDDFRLASIHKTAEIIYNAFGSARDEERGKAIKAFSIAIDGFIASIDNDRDGRSDSEEREETTAHGVR